jgi:4-hydroxybenzoyl-CoA reductase subunit alpha
MAKADGRPGSDGAASTVHTAGASAGIQSDGSLRVVGKSLPKVDAVAKVTGRTKFADDLFLPRMLHCRMLRATVPHAQIVSIETSRAESHPGVFAVLTGADLPTPYGILPVSQDEHAL